MKDTLRYVILAVLTAGAVFAACSKEQIGGGDSAESPKEMVRIISVTFDNSTKVAISGLALTFEDNDLIRVSNDTKSEVCTLKVVGIKAAFQTTLSGELTAIYPADAAFLSTGAADAPIVDPWFKVHATQDGTAAKAIIAKATIAAEAVSATFYNQTALFEVTPPSGATSFTITSLQPVVDGVARTGTAVAINTEGADDAAKRVITVTAVGSDGKAYVSLVPGVKLSDLSFDADGTYGMKGIPTKTITAAGKTDATAANKKYTINNSGWHPYVTIGGKKWATRNIGATADTGTESFGTYFAWGDVNGQTPSSDTFDPGFSWGSYLFAETNKPTFNKYVREDDKSSYGKDGTFFDDKTTLDLADDAANANWGGSWRMPTMNEFDALKSKRQGSYSPGYWFGDSESSKIFLPAAGYGSEQELENVGIYGFYWSSSLYLSRNVYALSIDRNQASIENNGARSRGRSVRPVSD